MSAPNALASLEALEHATYSDTFYNEEQRRKAVQLAHALLARIESPWETMARYFLIDPVAVSALTTLHNLQIFAKWEPVDSRKSLEELVELTGCEKRLLRRLLYMAIPKHWIDFSHKEQTFGLTPFTKSFCDASLGAMPTFYTQVIAPLSKQIPVHLERTKYANPTNVEVGVWSESSGQPFMAWLQQNPEAFESLHHAMRLRGLHSAKWTEFYPWREHILKRMEPGTVAFVDVGGGVGQDSNALLQKAPDEFPAGSIVLQDLQQVVDRADVDDVAIVRQGHSFFERQTVIGAATYFFHLVLHDWSDEKVGEILDNLKPAFKRGYSRLLINDIALTPSMDPMVATSDLHMLVNSAQERTKEEWEILLETSGFRIMHWYSSPLSEQALIEAELA